MAESRITAALPSRALIALGGADWRSFLHGLITQDVETLQPGEARFGALLTPQGRLLYDLFVIGRQDGAWLDVASHHRDALIQRLTLYRLRAKVEIAPLDLTVAASWSAERPPGDWIADPRLPALGWRGYGESADQPEAAYEAHRLSLGIPGPADWDTDAAYPIEANFDLLNGIDFHKGCFVGQETTSRMKRRGQVKSRMLPVAFDGPPPSPGTEILNGELRAGEMLSGIEGGGMALVRLDRIDGPLAAGGGPVRVDRPAWFSAALGEDLA